MKLITASHTEPHRNPRRKFSQLIKRFFAVLLNDFKDIYSVHPKPTRVIAFVLVLLLLTIWFKPLWTLFIFLLIDRAFVFLERNTSFALKIEHVTIAAVISAYYLPLGYSLLITIVMMSVLQIRNIKFTFLGAFIDGSIWLLICIVVALSKNAGASLAVMAFIIPIVRYGIKMLLNVMLGFQIHDFHKDSMNMLYQIFFLRYLAPIIIALLVR